MANIGRPRTTTADLPDGWQDIMRDCGQEGGSAVEARLLLGIGRAGWDSLIEHEPEFAEVEAQRSDLAQVWWERIGRSMASGAAGNATVWRLNMANRYGWSDRVQQDNTSSDGSHRTPAAQIVVTQADIQSILDKL